MLKRSAITVARNGTVGTQEPRPLITVATPPRGRDAEHNVDLK